MLQDHSGFGSGGVASHDDHCANREFPAISAFRLRNNSLFLGDDPFGANDGSLNQTDMASDPSERAAGRC